MIPVYFPFTHIAEPVAEAACRCFGGVVLYRSLKQDLPEPLATMARQLPLDIRVPARADDEQLIHLYQAYRKWGDLHEGGIGTFKNRFSDTDDAEAFVTQVRSEILGRRTRETRAPDPFFSARLFLLAAQDYDIAQETVDQALAASEINMARMVAALKGDALSSGSADDYRGGDDPGAFMTGARLMSWCRLSCLDTDADTGLLLTTSPAVCEALLNHVPSASLVHAWDSLPCPADDVQRALWEAYLADTAAVRQNETGSPDPPKLPHEFSGIFRFKLYRFPDITMEQMLNLGGSPIEIGQTIQPGIRNILVGLLETGKAKKRVLDSII